MCVQRVSAFLQVRPRLRPSRDRLAVIVTILVGLSISNLPWLSAGPVVSPHSLPFQISLQRASAAQGRPAGGGGGGDILVWDIVDSVSIDALSRIQDKVVLMGIGSTDELLETDKFGSLHPFELPSGLYLIVFQEFEAVEIGFLWVDADAGFVLGLRYQF